ncbi:hypothetical protein CBI38_36525 (plasmid) [Rhodococcus oxybenzonivorans]|uniref:Lipoprotein n=1 Tax=Rhodococcus oxybenzonivorans TaxID=1990687 RepID=A0A2S2C7N1_9NOCA|nr:hypothetical protein [Rhodococcus oxybenzonivorans]AWK76886.1 hypothetical protein CBI38_36525 [Rhodococcus oxybenzonivorans]
MNRRTTTEIAALSLITAAILTGCSSTEAETVSPSAEPAAAATHVEWSTNPTVDQGQPGVTDAQTRLSETQPATTAAQATAAAALPPTSAQCGIVTNNLNGATAPVIIIAGTPSCPAALSISDRYLNDRTVAAQGQGRFAVIDGWNCSWPYLPDRSHADSYLQCVDSTGNAVKIGD